MFEITDVMKSREIVDFERELAECKKKCDALELQIMMKNSEFQCLEHKFKVVVDENLAIKEEVGVLKKKYEELEKRMMLHTGGLGDVSEDTLTTETPSLPGTGEGCPSKEIASSIPGGSKRAFVGFIDVSDSNGEHEIVIPNVSTLENKDKKIVATDHPGINLNIKECASDNKIEETFLHQRNETMIGDKGNSPLTATRKRRASNIVNTDSEDEDIPVSKLNVDTQPADNNIDETFPRQSNEDMIGDKGNSPLNATHKRRRASNIVNSDSEDEDISVFKLNVDTQRESVPDFRSNRSPVRGTELGKNVHKTASKRRLVTLGNAASTRKRKGESNIVTVSEGDDDDDDDDDDVPISQLVTNISSVPAAVLESRVPDSVSRRRLASLRKFGDNWRQNSPNTDSNSNAMVKNYHPRNIKEDDGEDTSTEENESESGDESMEDFIDDGSDVSVKSDSEDSLSTKSDSGNSISKNSDNGEASGDSENSSCDDINYPEIISQLRRKRDSHTSKWEFEADMLADFGKDPEMCMKAVCALYRQQTVDEQSTKAAFYRNSRGFSRFDAPRGSSLGEFLTDGSGGELRKSVEELKQHSANGIELCRELAKRYSKQLFTIYKNKEDPFFLPDKIGD